MRKRIQLYNGDCLGILPKLKNESMDMVLTDPPFFLPSKHYEMRDKSWGKKYSDLFTIETSFRNP